MKYQVIQNNEKLAFPNERLVDEVVKKFNTWRFKRSQPSDTELLHKFVQWAIVTGNPIPFVLYWGKGMRAQSGVKERACLDYLLEMGRRIGDVYGPGAHFDILYTDTHATLNGHHPDDIEEYLKCLTADCGEDFRVWRLSEVVSASKEAVEDVPAIPAEEAEEMIERLVVCAEKWYRGSGRAVDGAARYFRMNMVERIAVEREALVGELLAWIRGPSPVRGAPSSG